MSIIVPKDTPTPIPTPSPIPPLSLQNQLFNFISENFLLVIGIITIIIVFAIIFTTWKTLHYKKKQQEFLYKDRNVGIYSIIMYRKIGDRFVEIDKKKINVKDQKWRYENKDFTTFNVNTIAFTDKKSNYYAFDYDTGSQLTFKEKGMPAKITIDDVDVYVNRKIIEQLVAGLEAPKGKGQWLLLIVGIILGLAIGIIIGMYLPKSGGSPTPTGTPKPIIYAIYGLIFGGF